MKTMETGEQLAEFFYEKASARINKSRKDSGLTQAQIYPPDPKQISKIINNKRDSRNRFLIRDSVLSSYDEAGNSIGLAPKLFNRSKKETLWGNEEEIRGYLCELFSLLWNTLCESKRLSESDFEEMLCFYPPYAKFSTLYRNVKDETPNNQGFKLTLFNVDSLSELQGLYERTKKEAIHFLYNNYQKRFFESFNHFAESHESFSKLPRELDNYLNIFNDELKTELKKYIPYEGHLGLRVRDLLSTDLNINDCELNIYSIGFKLFRASLEYCNRLEDYFLSKKAAGEP